MWRPTYEELRDLALRVFAAYCYAHPELGLVDAWKVMTKLHGGEAVTVTDDKLGTLTVTDSAGNVLVRVDATSWMPAKEG